MARFIILKNGANYKIFDFDGSIARVGGSANVDLQLSDTAEQDDICFLTKMSDGYELEPRSSKVEIVLNGQPVKDRTVLKEGDKISFADYLIITTYGSESQQPVVEDVQEQKPEKSTSPVVPLPTEDKQIPEEKKKATPKPPPPPPPVQKGSEKATTLLDLSQTPDFEPQAKKPIQQQTPVQNNQSYQSSKTDIIETPTYSSEPPTPSKARIKALYSLVGLSGQHKGVPIELDCEEFRVGRDPESDLVIDRDEQGQPEKSISREHFVLLSKDDNLYLIDKRSKLRTFLNKEPLEADQREMVVPEDIISIPAPSGEVKFRVCFAGEEIFTPDNKGESHSKIVFILAAVVILFIILLVIILK